MNELEFLKGLNGALKPLEQKLASSISTAENHANVFILGLPRSGTTLLSQVLFNSLNLVCINNLSAKFWETPLVGSFLSKIVVEDKKSGHFDSFFGRPATIYDPHEFSWFWHSYLESDQVSGRYDSIGDQHLVRLKKTLNQIANLFSSGLVYKPLELIFPILRKRSLFLEKCVYVYIERNELDVAMSILNARRTFTDSVDQWWSSIPTQERYTSIKDKPWNVQIAGQIRFLKEEYGHILQDIPGRNLVRTSYDELCAAPQVLVEKVCDSARRNGAPLNVIDSIKSFDVNKKRYSKTDVEQILQGFNRIEREFM